ncbi:Ig-like domain-containing protein [Ruminiclostridium cellobioparum]|uniref:Bacterial Ig-like domain (Group 2) n=1 Tax=Ruminiclostridium cellobioparum subsp. termitidis CT1112 TaxID=1195236 RepID=S0FFI3_RUMCE|nr:Ig-like domain-containing protein [Ruminiclostridium cellobioparum]EMS69705.1 Bacterial Ig-like domain (group 2) [Ruminiclostridium cellobioparum subsp. termitidis CT1112]
MYAVKTNKLFKLLALMLLLAIFVLPSGILTNTAQAAAKPSVEAKMTIGTGSIVGSFDFYSKEEGKYSLSVSDPVKNATYSFTSSNTKVLTVKASGTVAYLTGVKAGTATITVNQKLSGKTTKVGTCAVTVKNSVIHQDFVPELPLGSSVASEPLVFDYRNNDATYTYASNSKNFSMSETIKKFDGMNFISQSFTAKAPGTYTITVKETYNKITRTVGTIKYTVKKATVSAEGSVDLGGDVWAFELLNNYRTDVPYYFISDDKKVLDIVSDKNYVSLKGLAEGTTTLKIYENAKAADESKLIGKCKITVKKIKLTDLNIDFDETEAYVGGDPIEFSVEKEPYNAFDEITVTSSNPNVAKVSELDEEGFGTISPVSAGTATITITCGDITKTQDITVSEEDEY